jgi:hypothetical protein
MMEERQRRVVILLESLLDYLPAITPQPSSSPSQGTSRRCERCSGAGRVLGEGGSARPCIRCRDIPHGTRSHGCRPCLSCNETGLRRARRGDDAIDAMITGATLAVGPVLPMEMWQLDVEIARLEREARVRAGGVDDSLLGWERARRRQRVEGDYETLELALARLRDQQPGVYRLVWSVLVCGVTVVLSDRARIALDVGVARITSWMPSGPIRVPAWADTKAARDAALRRARGRAADIRAQRERNRAILDGALRGKSTATLAEEWGLTDRQVRRITKPARETA